MADEPIFEFSGNTTFCHIKKRRKLLLLIALILRQAPSPNYSSELTKRASAVVYKA
jgi:hypothetical protein